MALAISSQLCFASSDCEKAATGVTKKSKTYFSARGLSLDQLTNLVGSKIKVISSWPESKTTRAEGFVSAAHLTADQKQILIIRMHKNDGDILSFEHAVKGKSELQIKILEPSPIENIINDFQDASFRIRRSNFYDSSLSFAYFFRDLPANPFLRVLMISHDENIPTLKVAAGTLLRIPTDLEIALNFSGQDQTAFILATPNGDVEIKSADILAIAY